MSFLNGILSQVQPTKLSFTGDDFMYILPEFIVLVTACLLVIVDLILPKKSRGGLAWLALLGYVGALAAAGYLYYADATISHTTFSGMFVRDNFTLFNEIIFLITGILGILISPTYSLKRKIPLGELYSIQAFSVLGMMIVGGSGDLMAVFVGIELSSIAVYILTGFARNDRGSAEGALKYFLLGIMATAILVYGMAWTFGMTGSTNLREIGRQIASQHSTSSNMDSGITFAMLLLLVGFGFKIAAVPFHVWTPDAYEGAPTPISAFMSVGPKAAGFAALIRVMVEGMPTLSNQWTIIIAVLAVLTMTLGNVVAIAQNSVKRMLAYSSIAHTGYIMVGVAAYVNSNGVDTNVARQNDSISSVLIYSLIYVFMNIGAFGILIYLQNQQGGAEVDDFNGLARWSPIAALAMALCLFSLAGIPPTGGFFGKFFVFRAAINSNLLWLTIIGALNSAVSAFFYLRVVVAMYFNPQSEESKSKLVPTRSFFLTAALVIICVAILVLGLYPDPALKLAQDGATPLFQVVKAAAGQP
ncbi:MAG: NADH-quinone oxidoreductase subunit N [Chloroflexota bacterium]